MSADTKAPDRRQTINAELLQQIKELANSIHYGSINLVIQDGVLVSIEKNEKIRISKQ